MTPSCNKPSVAFWMTVVVVCLLPVIAYFGAYWWCVEPSRVGILSLPESLQPVVACYPRLGDSTSWEIFFTPANWLDRHLIRPTVWPDVEMEFLPDGRIIVDASGDFDSPVLVPPQPSVSPLDEPDRWLESPKTRAIDRALGVGPREITTREIIIMSENGVSDAIIIHVIQTRGGNFDTSPEAVAALTGAGISDAVIEAMRRTTCKDAADNESGGEEEELDRWRRASFSCPSSGRGGKSPP